MIDRVSETIDYNFLNDNKIIKIISECNLWTYCLFCLFTPVITCAIFVSHCDIDVNANSIEMFLWISFALSIAICIALEKYLLSARREKFAKETYKNSLLFKSEFIKVSKKCGESHYYHHIHFKDENGQKRKNEIPGTEYERLKNDPPTFGVYVLKYPKYKRGYGYMAFDSREFKNKSSIRIGSKPIA